MIRREADDKTDGLKKKNIRIYSTTGQTKHSMVA